MAGEPCGPVVVRNLQIHVADACNLACEGCSHYSNYGHKGVRSLATAEDWLAPWADRLLPKKFVLLGGGGDQPGAAWIRHAIPSHVFQIPKFVSQQMDSCYTGTIRPCLRRCVERATTDSSSPFTTKGRNISRRPSPPLHLPWNGERPTESRCLFARRRRGGDEPTKAPGPRMEPFTDGNARASWENCPGRHCLQVYEGQLYKCAPLAYLGMQHAKYELSPSWQPYLAYTPLAPGVPKPSYVSSSGAKRNRAAKCARRAPSSLRSQARFAVQSQGASRMATSRRPNLLRREIPSISTSVVGRVV